METRIRRLPANLDASSSIHPFPRTQISRIQKRKYFLFEKKIVQRTNKSRDPSLRLLARLLVNVNLKRSGIIGGKP